MTVCAQNDIYCQVTEIKLHIATKIKLHIALPG